MRQSWPRGLLAFTTARRETLKTGLLDARLTAPGPSPPGGRRGLPTFPAIRCRLVAPVRRARSSIGAACGGGAAAATGLACEEGPRPRPAVLGSPSAGARVLLSPLPQLRLHPVPSGLGAAETCRSHGGRGGPHCQEDGQDGAEEERGERGGWRGPGGSRAAGGDRGNWTQWAPAGSEGAPGPPTPALPAQEAGRDSARVLGRASWRRWCGLAAASVGIGSWYLEVLFWYRLINLIKVSVLL